MSEGGGGGGTLGGEGGTRESIVGGRWSGRKFLCKKGEGTGGVVGDKRGVFPSGWNEKRSHSRGRHLCEIGLGHL